MTTTIIPSTPLRRLALALAVASWLTAPLVHAVPVSAHQILADDPLTTSGVYLIDPDGPGGDAPFEVYADMDTFGGGWTLGLNSLRNSPAIHADMTGNTGTVGLATAHTRDMTQLALHADAQIRHQIVNNGQVVFDGYYTGSYHGTLSADLDAWTIAIGNLFSTFGSHQLGNDWSTLENDVDDYSGNCAAFYGPWYHGRCWTSHPGNSQNYTHGPYAYHHGWVDAWRIYVRGSNAPERTLPTVSEPSTLALAVFGLLVAGHVRRRRAAAIG